MLTSWGDLGGGRVKVLLCLTPDDVARMQVTGRVTTVDVQALDPRLPAVELHVAMVESDEWARAAIRSASPDVHDGAEMERLARQLGEQPTGPPDLERWDDPGEVGG